MNNLTPQNIKYKIHTIRNAQVMLDKDLAELYGVETKRVNEAVKNNTDKFPSDFYFELNKDEFEILQSKISTANFAKTRIWLIDNYIDETTLTLLNKNPNAKITLFTKNIAKSLRLDADKFNAQFSQRLTLKEFALCHDRFLIIDDEIYHFGVSLKDLGKSGLHLAK